MQAREWGKLPNVYWRAPTMQQLRDAPQFEALPPVDQVTVVGAASHRCAGSTAAPLPAFQGRPPRLAPMLSICLRLARPEALLPAGMCVKMTRCGISYTRVCSQQVRCS